MSEFINFLYGQWAIVSAMAVILVALIVNEWLLQRSGVPRLSTLAAVQVMNGNEAIVIDIRDRAAYDMGHILGAINLLPAALSPESDTLKRYASKTIIISCSNGLDSRALGAPLLKAGFKVYCLDGGITAWKEAQLPLVKV